MLSAVVSLPRIPVLACLGCGFHQRTTVSEAATVLSTPILTPLGSRCDLGAAQRALREPRGTAARACAIAASQAVLNVSSALRQS
jgi:hypothetical protein